MGWYQIVGEVGIINQPHVPPSDDTKLYQLAFVAGKIFRITRNDQT